MRLLRRLLIVLFALALLLVAGAALSADGFARRTLEQQLAEAFTTEVVLDEVDLRLFQGTLEVTGLQIDNPPGFSDQPLFSAQRFEGTVRLASLFSSPLVIERAILQGPRIQVVLREDGSVNLALARRPAPPLDEEPPAPEAERFGMRIEQLEIVGLELHYEDQSKSGEPVLARLGQVDLRLFGLELGKDGDEPVSDLRIGGRLEAGNALAPLRVSAYAPPPGAGGFEDFDVDLYAAGLDLRPFQPYLTRAASTLLGGRYLDVGLRCRARDNELSGRLLLRSSGGEEYALPLAGTVADPRLVDNAGIRAAFQLPREKLERVLGAVTGTGRFLGRTAVARAGDVVKGAGRAAGQVGRAGKQVASGLKDAVTDPTQIPEQAVETAKKLGEKGVGLVGSILKTGKKVADKTVDTVELGLNEILSRQETDAERTRRLAEEDRRFRAAVREMLRRRRQAALDVGGDETVQRIDRELEALDTGLPFTPEK